MSRDPLASSSSGYCGCSTPIHSLITPLTSGYDKAIMIDPMTNNAPGWYSPPPMTAPRRPSPLDLLDIKFERRFGPILVRWLYLTALAMVGVLTLFGVLMSWSLASWAGWGFWLGIPISIATGLVWALAVRLVCEQLIHWTAPEAAPREAGTL